MNEKSKTAYALYLESKTPLTYAQWVDTKPLELECFPKRQAAQKPSRRMVQDWQKHVKKFEARWDSDDEAFDEAFDVAMNHNDAPMYDGEIDTEVTREFAYELLEEVIHDEG